VQECIYQLRGTGFQQPNNSEHWSRIVSYNQLGIRGNIQLLRLTPIRPSWVHSKTRIQPATGREFLQLDVHVGHLRPLLRAGMSVRVGRVKGGAISSVTEGGGCSWPRAIASDDNVAFPVPLQEIHAGNDCDHLPHRCQLPIGFPPEFFLVQRAWLRLVHVRRIEVD
jgi:hypothetical protein